MREWKYVRDGLVHDVETWNEAKRLRTPRCDVAERITCLSYTEHPTTCLECLSIRGSRISRPVEVERPAEPGYFETSHVYAPADRNGMFFNPCGEIPLYRKGRGYGT